MGCRFGSAVSDERDCLLHDGAQSVGGLGAIFLPTFHPGDVRALTIAIHISALF